MKMVNLTKKKSWRGFVVWFEGLSCGGLLEGAHITMLGEEYLFACANFLGFGEIILEGEAEGNPVC